MGASTKTKEVDSKLLGRSLAEVFENSTYVITFSDYSYSDLIGVRSLWMNPFVIATETRQRLGLIISFV